MKRSNRLVLLVGIFLAIVAFVGIAILLSGPGTGTADPNQPATTATVVVAKADIPLSAKFTVDNLETKTVPLAGVQTGAYTDVSQVIGLPARQSVLTGQQITSLITSGGSGQVLNIEVPTARRAMAVQVDQVTGVGTVIKTGDYVDMIVGFTADKFPIVELPAENDPNAATTVVSGLNGTSVKLLLQGMQVLGTLLPPPPAQQNPDGTPATGDTPTSLTGQQEIVIVSVTPQQAEVIKFAQMDGNISLVLRNTAEFLDPETGLPLAVDPVGDPTTGMILRILVDDYGVLVPELVEAILPTQPN